MSRIGKQPIIIPDKTTVTVENNAISVEGPKGKLSRAFSGDNISVEVAEGTVVVKPKNDGASARALWGTTASHISNMVQGVNEEFSKKLVVEGVGFKVDVSGSTLTLHVGFSHPLVISVPEGLTVQVEKNIITVSGANKEMVGQFAAHVRSLKKPEPYKGKGIRYEDEVIKRKQGKKAVT